LPDDYINVLHLDRKGRMWVGTQNGLARYVGAYRFHRVALPAHHHNIIAIEDSPEKHDSLAILVSDGNQTYRIGGDEKITPSSHSIQPNNLQAPLPADLSILRKPAEVVTATFCDLGGNLWVGYRNAGVQIISQNRIAYKKANANALSDKTKGISILTMATVGRHVLAGTALRVFAYDEKNSRLEQTLFRDLFDSLPKPRQINLNNMVGYDDEHLWLVSEHQVLSCRINNERIEVLAKSPLFKSVLGQGLKAGNASAPSKNLPRILIVDDDVDVADYLHYLFAPDYEVVNRYSAEEALADLEEVKPDIILSDIIMGDMSGLEFCKMLKGNLSFSHIPVVLITAMASMHNQIDGLKLGAVAYITKPFDPAYLKALVKSQLQNMQMLRQRLGEMI
jgi:CheY-like chemotaxis protein